MHKSEYCVVYLVLQSELVAMNWKCKFVSFDVLFVCYLGHLKNEALVPKKQETAEEIFSELNLKHTSASRRLVLLNGFIKLINAKDGDPLISAYNTEEILIR